MLPQLFLGLISEYSLNCVVICSYDLLNSMYSLPTFFMTVQCHSSFLMETLTLSNLLYVSLESNILNHTDCLIPYISLLFLIVILYYCNSDDQLNANAHKKSIKAELIDSFYLFKFIYVYKKDIT